MAVSDLARARTALVRATHSTRTIFGSTVGGLGVAEGFAGQHDCGGSGRVGVVGFAVRARRCRLGRPTSVTAMPSPRRYRARPAPKWPGPSIPTITIWPSPRAQDTSWR
ncbi:hypothetical protein [Mycobacterium lentiflavum]|uniref:hypothetical protein n=1 Tax=Mycobacterium lentiflavum TaxID=141349 RepID=UPI001FD4151C|nr:hypothetical protein [Mycobacterium lentiflavum]